ncbi:hypothetical protein BH11BAC1_BH11BAC1_10970 [soil metagenome]
MSTKEVQDIIHQLGVFMFRGGSINEGMLVARYNIKDARIEYYFIHTSKLNDYSDAKKAHEFNAHQRLGNMIDVNTIVRAQLFN